LSAGNSPGVRGFKSLLIAMSESFARWIMDLQLKHGHPGLRCGD
jgi:hypothetical protein